MNKTANILTRRVSLLLVVWSVLIRHVFPYFFHQITGAMTNTSETTAMMSQIKNPLSISLMASFSILGIAPGGLGVCFCSLIHLYHIYQ